ncbi:MAG TPA: hypothetical protein VFO60_06410 [Candidatus Dormibacteraeota bacterium]|nr:hypothetical protein [Candidatus Dormibacteraeota bacterium]
MLAVPAHAKVNLALEVVGRRPDGYHDLVTVFALLDWHDVVTVDLRHGSGADLVCMAGPTADPAMGAPGSLLSRTAAELRALAVSSAREGGPGLAGAAALLDVRIEVDKRLPVAAGLGGGSADVAAVLRAGAIEVHRLLGIRIAPRDLSDAGARLGADVPAVLAGGSTLARGRGEVLEPLPGAPRLHLAVAVAGPSSTAAVFGALTDAERCPDGRAARVASALARGRPPNPSECGSALEVPATRVSPALAAAISDLRRVTGLRWPMTGSGGAVFEIAGSAAEAALMAQAAAELGRRARACRSLPLALADPGGRPDPTIARPTIAP